MWCIKQGVLEINIVINSLFQGSSRRTKFLFFFSSQLAGNESCSLGNVNVCKEAIALSCGGNKGWEFLVYLLSLCQMSKLLQFSTGSSLHVSMIMGGWRFACPMTRKLSCDLRNGPFAWLKHARIYRFSSVDLNFRLIMLVLEIRFLKKHTKETTEWNMHTPQKLIAKPADAKFALRMV